jgi:hypothetical protein
MTLGDQVQRGIVPSCWAEHWLLPVPPKRQDAFFAWQNATMQIVKEPTGLCMLFSAEHSRRLRRSPMLQSMAAI